MEKIKRYGSVVSTSGNNADIIIKHHNGCSGEHNGCPFKNSHKNDVQKDIVITANNKINAKEGQFVEISVPGKKISGYAFLLFIFPLLMIFSGALTGHLLSKNLTNNNLFASIGGVFGFLLSILIIRRVEKKSQNTYEITKIISL